MRDIYYFLLSTIKSSSGAGTWSSVSAWLWWRGSTAQPLTRSPEREVSAKSSNPREGRRLSWNSGGLNSTVDSKWPSTALAAWGHLEASPGPSRSHHPSAHTLFLVVQPSPPFIYSAQPESVSSARLPTSQRGLVLQRHTAVTQRPLTRTAVFRATRLPH